MTDLETKLAEALETVRLRLSQGDHHGARTAADEALRLYDAAKAQPVHDLPLPRLTDGQWVNIVNHANCYRDMGKDDAVALAVKLTEARMVMNAKENQARAAPAATPAPAPAPLTDEQIIELLYPIYDGMRSLTPITDMKIARAIERAHGIGKEAGNAD